MARVVAAPGGMAANPMVAEKVTIIQRCFDNSSTCTIFCQGEQHQDLNSLCSTVAQSLPLDYYSIAADEASSKPVATAAFLAPTPGSVEREFHTQPAAQLHSNFLSGEDRASLSGKDAIVGVTRKAKSQHSQGGTAQGDKRCELLERAGLLGDH